MRDFSRKPIGLPPRKGDTGSDYPDSRDASCVPVFFGVTRYVGRFPGSGATSSSACVRRLLELYAFHAGPPTPAFRTDWVKLGPVLARTASAVVDGASASEYQGLNFYGS